MASTRKPLLCLLGLHGFGPWRGFTFVRFGWRDYHLACPRCGFDGGHVPASVIEGLPSFTGWDIADREPNT